ncbi:acetyl-coenzyme A synthetase [Paenibacillus pini JCM 16418]|uniref:Acetyl-coenzyme A synthetase n=1 Tax=Paenibacillus pini JCM 16418 TaxID=1236976 RepID=W7YHV1_9BACL|nr:acetyl-coenzyme A synthetase [Paenibacillus pini JCM 16418]
MDQIHNEILPSVVSSSNLGDYEQARSQFQWEDVEKHFTWYETGKVNMAYEAIDRHVAEGRGDKTALLYSDATRDESYTFADIKEQSDKFGNVLRNRGIGKGDRVFIFMARGPELYFALMGILKVGAIVGPLFEAFMETAVKDRLEDSGAVALVTTTQLLGRVKKDELPDLKHIFVIGDSVQEDEQIIDFAREMDSASTDLELEWLDRSDGLIIHYTSGSTGKPKGVYHVQNAMLQHYYTGKMVLDLQEDDVYWCTADPGWVTGTSYGIFAPWLNGVTNVIRGGRFSPQDWYGTIDKYKVTVWYSAPTAFRMLMGASTEVISKFNLSSYVMYYL